MTDITLSREALNPVPGPVPHRATPDLLSMAWRNVMRTRRRTWLTASGIALPFYCLV